MNNKKLIIIYAPYFTAGIEIDEETLPPKNRCAPIVKYMKSWSLFKIKRYCYKKKWKYIIK